MSDNEWRGSYGLRVFLLTLVVSLILGGPWPWPPAPRMT